jgi:hypothetical protein
VQRSTVFWSFDIFFVTESLLAAAAMTADSLFETTSIPGHLAPTPERLERLLSKQTLQELYEVEEQPFAR